MNPPSNPPIPPWDSSAYHPSKTSTTEPGNLNHTPVGGLDDPACAQTSDKSSLDEALQPVMQRLRLEIKLLNKRIRRERAITLFCLWLQFACIAWLQFFQPTADGNEPHSDLPQPEVISQKQGNGAQDPLQQSGDQGSRCIALTKPSTGSQTSGFGPRIHPITGKRTVHQGIDFAAEHGSPILAAAAGKVIQVGDEQDGYGLKIIIRHVVDGSQAFETLYAHLSQINIQVGQAIEQGEIIGLVGSTGLSTGPHLHFEVRVDGVPHNPAGFINKPFGRACK